MVILLLIGIVPRILYGIFHTRKCPVCGTRTTRKKSEVMIESDMKKSELRSLFYA